MAERIHVLDTTLRDGAQTRGVDFSVADKRAVAERLDALGIDYVEAGWPGANPTDDAFFGNPPELVNSKLTAFTMTRRPGRSSANDPGLAAVYNTRAVAHSIVGKTWDLHVTVALSVSLDENIDMIADSVAESVARGREVLFDCEHFFDGFKTNPDYALRCARAACEAGARWVVLCDTNGGCLPHEIREICGRTLEDIPGDRLGIHTHNDTENAIANSIEAVRAGVRHVQGTLNGIGERCGNANLISLIPNLMVKLDYDLGIERDKLAGLTHLSRWFDERLNKEPQEGAAYVGARAFAHKGGLHASAVAKAPRTYEHIPPDLVGNRRTIPVSDQSGRSNLLAQFKEMGLKVDPGDRRVDRLIEDVKRREFEGYAYDTAGASFEILARRALGQVPDYFVVDRFTVTDERRRNAVGRLVQESEATVRVKVGDRLLLHEVSDGNGPVNALDRALRKALEPIYPDLEAMRLVDFKVRILAESQASAAQPRVVIESRNGAGASWFTMGLSTNIIDAAFDALCDSLVFHLFHNGASPPPV